MVRLGIVVLLAGCGTDPAAPAVPDAPPPALAPTCNPVIGDDCLTPFPSSYFEVAAPTATAVQVALPADALPKTRGGLVIRPDRLNATDGFSPSTLFLAYFAAGVDASALPGYADPAASVTAASTVQILGYDGGARVPLFAELDANAQPGDRQGLLVHPLARLAPATRYIVALVGLRDAGGRSLAPAPFVALRDRTALTPELAALAPHYEEIFARLAAAGVPRASLSLAWDVVTASDATATGHLVAMRDHALAELAAGRVTYSVVSATDTPADAHRLRELQVAVTGPWYLASSADDALMNLDAAGQPAQNGSHAFPVTIEVPRCAAAATAPLPFVVFGHGLFGNAKDTLADARLLAIADQLCMVLIGTDWIGTSSADIALIARYVLPDLNKIYLITDRLQQAHVNAQVMTRLFATAMKDDPALAVGGRAVSDGKEGYYFGASDGGIQGATFMALTPDIVRGVLNVPGCEWSLMMWRSTQFNALYPVLATIIDDALDRQVLTAASQSEFDYTDPASFAAHIIRDPLPGTPAKRVILQESIGDAQVPNMSTEILARAIGVQGLELVHQVYGVTEAAGPLDSAYTQWNIHPTPLPPTVNTPAPADNGAHGGIQSLPPLVQQIADFFHPDGRVEGTCGGPCDFPP